MDEIESRLKFIRKKAGFSQKKLAERLGVTARTLQRYEKDASILTIKIATNISYLCGVDLLWLMTGQGMMETSEAKSTESIVRRFKEPKRGLGILERLLKIEELSEKVYDRVDVYIESAYDTLMVEKGNDDSWAGLEHRINQEPWEGGERRRNGTEDE
jgi:transcriptional regulator with XRE-family HTH domain